MRPLRCLAPTIVFLGTCLLATDVFARVIVLNAAPVTQTEATIRWQTRAIPVVNFQIEIRRVQDNQIVTSFPFAGIPTQSVGTTNFYQVSSGQAGLRLTPATRYEVIVRCQSPPGTSFIGRGFFITAGNGNGVLPGNGGIGGITPFGGGIIGGNYIDPIAARLAAAGKLIESQGKYLESQGKYAKLQAEARKKIAEAVDLELDNWKKKVDVYFARREMNEKGRMRLRDLYDVRRDQTLRLEDTAARRRYEYVTRHAGPRRGDAENLDFLVDLFVGTPIGYGVALEELVDDPSSLSRWRLTPEMLEQIRVRSRSSNGVYIEFRLNSPDANAIATEWPVFFRQPKFAQVRDQIDRLNQSLMSETTEAVQSELIAELEDAFASLSREFFRFHGPSPQRAKLDRSAYRELITAEDFLLQKNREVEALKVNPRAAIAVLNSFVPDVHGRDAGTLIAWMNSRGVRFAKPKVGEEAGYQQLALMLQELYVLSGAPIMDVPQTEIPEEIKIERRPIAPDEDEPDEAPAEPAAANL